MIPQTQGRELWRTAAALVKQPLYANAGYLMGVNVLGPILGFAFWWLAARLYTPDEVGTGSAVWAAVMLVSGLATLGIDNSIVRFLPESGAPHRFLCTGFTLGVAAAGVLGAVYLLGLRFWSPSLLFLQRNPALFAAFLLVAANDTVRTAVRMTFVARRRADYTLLHIGTMNAGRLVLVVALARLGTAGLVLSMAFSSVLALATALAWLLPRVEPGFRLTPAWNWDDLGTMMPYAVGNHAASLLTQISQTVLPILTLEVLGAEASGHAYIAWQLGWVLLSPGNALAGSALAEASNAPHKLRSLLARTTVTGMAVTLALSAGVALVAPWLLNIFGASYAEASTGMLRWLAAAAPLVILAQIAFTYLRIEKRVLALAGLTGLIGAATLGGAAVLMPVMGLRAWGVGWLMGNGLVALVGIVLGARLGLGADIVGMAEHLRAIVRRPKERNGQDAV